MPDLRPRASARLLLSLLLPILASLLPGCPGGDLSDASVDVTLDVATCALASDCDDGRFCNGVETCVSGFCIPGSAPACDDGISCTVDSCSEPARACQNLARDSDGDGYGAIGCGSGTDCDDTNSDVFPGNVELCDAEGRDEDCDPSTRGGIDEDGDGFESSACCNGTDCGPDCDDARSTGNPDGTEVCNGLDDNCDGTIDEGLLTLGFADRDRDGFGDSSMPLTACGTAVGFAVTGGDCDDAPGTGIVRSPGQPEFCDGIDNDCDPDVDEDAAPIDWFVDSDGDGFGSRSSGAPISSCEPIAGRVLDDRDCDDSSSSFSPRAPEVCNGLDDDCNGLSDFMIAPGDFEDDDGDLVVDIACAPLGTDCDDTSPSIGSGDAEICDGRDNDCDESVDEDAATAVFFRDADGDGYGSDRSGAVVGCAPPMGYVSRGGDCDDMSEQRSPDASETCNGSDEDCDGTIDEASMCPFGGTCHAGACRDPMCAPGTDDCDADPSTCETNVATSPAHCGACGRRCDGAGTSAAPTCSAGACVLSCLPNRDNCDFDPLNGCETDLGASLTNCGTCGRRCDIGTGDTFACTGGSCTVAMCRSGTSNCDGNAANGCETAAATCPACGALAADCNLDGICEDLASNDLNCGRCGTRCGTASTCGGGACDHAVELDSHFTATCARFEGGRIACWGDNSRGALGQVNTPSFPGEALEVFLPSGRAATEVSMADSTACAVLDDASVWCWGDNNFGELGNGVANVPPFVRDPIRVVGLPPALHVAVGRDFACAMHPDGSVSCWGTNTYHQIDGNGATTDVYAPRAVGFYPEPILTPSLLAAGERGVCVANVSGGASCIGDLPSVPEAAAFDGTLVGGLFPSARIVDLTMGGNAACVRHADNTMRCWGRDDDGVLGRGVGGSGYSASAAPASALGSTADGAVNQWTLCAIDPVGALRCVGDNQFRMSGSPATSATTAMVTPVLARTFAPGTVLSRSGGTRHICALEPSGRIWCWGQNTVAQCGVAGPAPVLAPTLVGGL